MAEIIRTSVHKRASLHFLVDGLQVWVSYLDENEGGPFGVMVKWLEHRYSSSPLEHITDDGGLTFKPSASYFMPEGVEKVVAEPETDPEKVARLNRIWVEYQKKLGEPVFSV
jgi:hypothetical protein